MVVRMQASGQAAPRERTASGYGFRALGLAASPRNDDSHPAGLSAHDRLGGVAHGFDVLAGIEEGDDAAGTAFEALITPGEGADERAPVEHKLNVAAKILGMQE